MPTLYLQWQVDPVLLGSLLTAAVVYGLAAGPLRSRIAPGKPFPTASALGFYATLALVYLLEGSPLHDLAERYSLTAHMSQHLALSYVTAPLLLVSTPGWMLRPLLLQPGIAPVARALTRPLAAFAIFSLAFSLWHMPVIYDGALRNEALHHAEHVLFLGTSLLLWWPLMSRLPELPRPGYLVQLVYLFLLPVAQLPVFGAITFSDRVLYDTYAAAPWTLGLSTLEEQSLAGALMKVVGLFAFGIPFAVIFFRWYREESSAPTPRGAATAGSTRAP